MSVSSDYLEQEFKQPSLWRRLGWFDWLWALVAVAGSIYAHVHYAAFMDNYEIGILYGTALTLIWLGWSWKPIRQLSLVIGLLSLFAIGLYGEDLARGDTSFFLKYLVSSQSAIMWMSALYVMATFAYFFGMFARSEFSSRVGSALTWSATAMGFTGLMVRWRESYLISHDVGHIPVSNLYEVFILFAVITALMYLYYEGRYRNRQLGGFVLTVISAAVAFLLWYSFARGAHEIQPLVPALQSYWMKLHVPTNFIGYGGFALAAMVAVAYLLVERRPGGWLAARLPSLEQMDDVMYKAIALGFAFFTVATVLGAMWAAEAWGGYWSWDPKETWALIVWLNYAAWLHLRLTKGWRGRPLAWWSVIGLFITLFAFLGVNMFLSGLHSYGTL
ncbi:c-type cytochrome biogenesis protein CcsB [Sulfurivermis fontis]|uniref:c-type cytochrome biogenesis protein CcsB n=1 Tax=Sulfurivermis fontis TaxID=1972068 RepID=UPI000FDA983C|nr:c-type cytochrome biogenesis protein CcsB [Sulfurivermis fontis]